MAPLITLITGCSSGIGLATAVKMAKDPKKSYIVYATMRNLAKKGDLEKAAGNTLNVTLFVRQLDITSEDSIVAIVKELKEKHGKVDILVNNAAFGWVGPLEEMSMAHMRNMSETNMVGTFRMTQEVLPIMKQQMSGHIINISSLAGINGFPFCSVYSGTKFAMEGFTEALYPELKCFNVKISSIAPGPVTTSFMENMAANQDSETKKPDSNNPTNKIMAGWMADVMKGMQTATQQSDDVGDVIINCIQAKDPALRYGTSEVINKCIADRFSKGGVGDGDAKNMYKIMEPYKSAPKH